MRRFRIPPAVLLLFSFSILAPAWAQEAGAQRAVPIAVRVSHVAQLPDPIDKLFSEPPDITLVPRGEGARHGHLWIRAWPDGLFIAGKVDGGPPDFPYTRDQILAKDHVEVWLAGAPDVDLPEIGWGNQFEDVTLEKGPESCADWVKSDQFLNSRADFDPLKACQEWAASQVRYRPYFQRLFARQWLMTPDFTVEAFATPAFEEIQRWFGGLPGGIPDVMKPQRNPNLLRPNTRLHPEPTGYSFEVFIPQGAFPPMPAQSVGELYLLVDVFNAAPVGKKMGAYSTSSPARVWGKPGTFNKLWLDPPISFSVTPCNLPLTGTDKRREDHPAWLVPDPDPSHPFVSDTFIIVNDPVGYRYEPEGLSPTVRMTHHFWKNVGKDEWVCGPEMTYTKGGRSYGDSSTIGEEGFDTKRLPDGTLLVKVGPRATYSEFGSGQCGACPYGDLRIFDVGKDLIPYQALALGNGVGGDIGAQDFTVSPDWSRITEYDLSMNRWSSTTWCLEKNPPPEDYMYQICDQKENVKPPNPPVVKELRYLDLEPPSAQAAPQTSETEIPKSNQAPGVVGEAPAGVLPRVEAVAPPSPSPVQLIAPSRIRVGPEVASAKLIFQPQPEYPPMAKMARIQGVVRLDAVINKDGAVQDLRVISGHPLLAKAALDAVQRWRYQPTLLNGDPVEVATEIDVPFALPQ